MTYAKRTDANQREIVSALRRLGYSVVDTSRIGSGFPDLVVGKAGKTWLIEIKSSKKAGYTPDQMIFGLKWSGSKIKRINSLEEAIDWAKECAKKGLGERESHPDK